MNCKQCGCGTVQSFCMCSFCICAAQKCTSFYIEYGHYCIWLTVFSRVKISVTWSVTVWEKLWWLYFLILQCAWWWGDNSVLVIADKVKVNDCHFTLCDSEWKSYCRYASDSLVPSQGCWMWAKLILHPVRVSICLIRGPIPPAPWHFIVKVLNCEFQRKQCFCQPSLRINSICGWHGKKLDWFMELLEQNASLLTTDLLLFFSCYDHVNFEFDTNKLELRLCSVFTVCMELFW